VDPVERASRFEASVEGTSVWGGRLVPKLHFGLTLTGSIGGRQSRQRHRDNTVTRPLDFKRYTA
jgi:hypothetical protein